jgi:DedD protein
LGIMSMEEKAKERVVGAAVLMAAAVIFIPMILSGPADDAGEEAPESAPASEDESRKTDAGFSSRIVPLGGRADAGAAAAETSPPPVKSPSPPAKKPASPARVAKPAPKPVAKTAPKPRKPPARASPKPAAGKGWVVQLGSFANPRNAHALRDRLKGKGYSAFAVSSGKGKEAVTRVYVGPEADRSKAEGHVERLLKETRLKGIVVRRPG